MVERGAFLVGCRIGQLIRGLRSDPEIPKYNVTFVNGILYISNAPAKPEGNMLLLTAAATADAGGE